jgi:hypothetical protein
MRKNGLYLLDIKKKWPISFGHEVKKKDRFRVNRKNEG